MGIHPTRCYFCDKNLGIERDNYGRLICEQCLEAFAYLPEIKKQHRNNPCKCGSGKKYKKCCLRGAKNAN